MQFVNIMICLVEIQYNLEVIKVTIPVGFTEFVRGRCYCNIIFSLEFLCESKVLSANCALQVTGRRLLHSYSYRLAS